LVRIQPHIRGVLYRQTAVGEVLQIVGADEIVAEAVAEKLDHPAGTSVCCKVKDGD